MADNSGTIGPRFNTADAYDAIPVQLPLTLTDYLKQYAIPPRHKLVSVEKAKQAIKEWLETQPINAWRDEIINMVDEP